MNERSESLFTISKMQVLVIGEKESLRSAPLVQRLTQNNLVKVEEINASITKNLLDVETLQIRFNQKLAQIFDPEKRSGLRYPSEMLNGLNI